MKKTSNLSSFAGLVFAAAFFLQGCAPKISSESAAARAESEADGVSRVSSRLWNGWRVDCHQDKSLATGHDLYVFSRATEEDKARLSADDWGRPLAANSIGIGQVEWVDDHSSECQAKGFYAKREADGSLAPASVNFAYDGDENGQPQSRRRWKGFMVDCYSDTSWSTRGDGLYQFKQLAKGQGDFLPSDGFVEPDPAGRVRGKVVFWVADRSMRCRSRGFYVSRSPEGQYYPVGIGYSYRVGKSVHGGAAIIEGEERHDAGGAQKPKPPRV